MLLYRLMEAAVKLIVSLNFIIPQIRVIVYIYFRVTIKKYN